MDLVAVLLCLVLVTLLYGVYRLHRLEELLRGDSRFRRRQGPRPLGEGKVIPILKDHVEPGPFNRRPNSPPPETEK